MWLGFLNSLNNIKIVVLQYYNVGVAYQRALQKKIRLQFSSVQFVKLV